VQRGEQARTRLVRTRRRVFAARVLVPEHQHFSHCRLVAAEQHDDQAEYLASQYVEDLEQHPPPNHHMSSLSATVQVNHATEYSSGTGSGKSRSAAALMAVCSACR